MTRTVTALLVGLALVAGVSAESRAAALILIEEHRSVETLPTAPISSDGTGSLFDATVGNTVAVASQESTLLPGAYVGSAEFYTDGGGGDASSILDVRFTVSEAVSFHFAGSISGGTHSGLFTDPFFPLHVLDGDFAFGGILVPAAHYRIQLSVEDAGTNSFSAGQWSFSLTIPEPSAESLALVALLTLAALSSCDLRRSVSKVCRSRR